MFQGGRHCNRQIDRKALTPPAASPQEWRRQIPENVVVVGLMLCFSSSPITCVNGGKAGETETTLRQGHMGDLD